MNLHTITTAQVIKTKARLKGVGLLNEKDNLLIGVFIQAMETKDVSALNRDSLIEIWHLVQFGQWLDENKPKMKYKNNKRISLD